MKTLAEKIQIMQAALDGAEIEFCTVGFSDWVPIHAEQTVWNWDQYDYRVAKPTPKNVVIQTWIHMPTGALAQRADFSDPLHSGWIHIPSLDKEVEVPNE